MDINKRLFEKSSDARRERSERGGVRSVRRTSERPSNTADDTFQTASQQLRRLSWAYSGFQTFIALLLWVPIFYAYQTRLGLSPAEYFAIQSLYYWIFFALEIPTGYIADRWGYKTSLIAASAMMMVSNLSAIFWTSFAGFLGHFVLIAVARSLTSGAANAYLFESLKRLDQAQEYKRLEGQARASSLYARLIGWSCAGVLLEWHITLPYWLTALACLLALACCVGLPALENSHPPTAFLENLKNIRRELTRSRRLWALIFAGSGVFILVRLSQVNLYQPILESKDFSVAHFGWIMAAMTVVEGFAASHAWRLQRHFEDLSVVLVATVLVALCLIGITFSGQVGTVLLFASFAFFSGLTFPLIRQQMNEAIPADQHRATILSVESMVHRALTGTAAALAGWMVAQGQMTGFLQGLSVLSALIVVIALGCCRRSNDKFLI